MNARHNALGPGNRANATIGRAVRLVAHERDRRRPASDASSFGHPGKFTLCFAEGPAAALGAAAPRSSATPRGHHGHDRAAEGAAPARAAAHRLGRGRSALVRGARSPTRRGSRPARAARRAVLGPEHAGFCARVGAGPRCASSSYEAARVSAARARGRRRASGDRSPARHDTGRRRQAAVRAARPTTSCSSPRAARARAGRSGCPRGRRPIHAYRATRRVRPAGEPLPGCGPDGCIVPWMRETRSPGPAPRRARRAAGDASTARALARELPERPVIGLIANGKPLARELLDACSPRRLGRAVERRPGSRSRAPPTRSAPRRPRSWPCARTWSSPASATEAPARRAVCTTR